MSDVLCRERLEEIEDLSIYSTSSTKLAKCVDDLLKHSNALLGLLVDVRGCSGMNGVYDAIEWNKVKRNIDAALTKTGRNK